MEVKNPLAFLDKRGASHTKTFITNLLIGLVAFALFSGISSIASAQEETETTSDITASTTAVDVLSERQEALEERREEMASRTDAFQAEMEARKETMASRTEAVREQISDRKIELSDRSRNRVLALANNITEKMTAAVVRLEQISDRFASRIASLKTTGVDTTAAEIKLSDAQAHLARATVLLDTELDTVIDNALSSDNPQATWREAQAAFASVRDALTSARNDLRETLSLLRTAISNSSSS